MNGFLREYWPWIVIPFALVVGAIVFLYATTQGDGPSPFVYNIGG